MASYYDMNVNERRELSTFYVLGAGFSRAISPQMPLLPDLATGVLGQLGLPRETLRPFDDNLEQWLSHISVDQPWLDDGGNLTNRAAFLRASLAVRKCIESAEATAVESPPKLWLLRLAWDMCERQAKVATFNYDLLLERAASHARRVHTWTDLYGISLHGRYPVGTGPFFSPQPPPGNVFTLFKLHGSTNWGHGGMSGATHEAIVLMRGDPAWRAPDAEGAHAARQRDTFLYDDLVPMIVPPTTTKNPYYGNTALRAQWRRAHDAMCAARKVVIIGFSFPSSDLQVRHFMATAVAPSTNVIVVDRRPESVSTVRGLLPQAGEITSFIGDSAVSDYVNASCGDLIRWGMIYEPDGWDVALTVNGSNVLDEAVTLTKPWRSQDGSSIGSWLKAEVARRWPSIDVEEATSDPDQPANASGHLSRIAYIPKTP